MLLLNFVFICVFLVWKLVNFSEKIIRILFFGNVFQYKIVEGLEKVKYLDFLKFFSCSVKDLFLKGVMKKLLVVVIRLIFGKFVVGRFFFEVGKVVVKFLNDIKVVFFKFLNG